MSLVRGDVIRIKTATAKGAGEHLAVVVQALPEPAKSQSLVVVPITSNWGGKERRVAVSLRGASYRFLDHDSVATCSWLTHVDRPSQAAVGRLSDDDLRRVDVALHAVLGLPR